ncbi:MAG: tetratricopeptide repeat-containing protein kinase family protein [Polyangiaceae bacterium]
MRGARGGLLHRDFKPDNAVIGADGRVRVIDFGLAEPLVEDQVADVASAGAPDAPNAPAPAAPADADAPVIPRGSGALSPGTPRYMAPEQLDGGAATAASDQFAFAVSLREAATRSGAPALPRWLEAIVRRGSATDPAARYETLRALLRALADDPASRWRRRALVAGPVAFALVGFAVGHGRKVDPPPCDGSAALAPVWTPARSASVVAHLEGLGTPFAVSEALRVPRLVDGWSERWIAAHQTGCAARRRGSFSATLEDLHLACMSAARTRLDTTLEIIAGAGTPVLPAAVAALSELPEPELCGDASALANRVSPPPMDRAADAAALGAELERVAVRVEAADPGAVPAAEQLVERARELEYRPTLARALLVLGRSRMAIGERQGAVAPMTEATSLALSSGDDPTAVEAFARAMWLRSASGGDAAPALNGLELIAPLAERLPPTHRFERALLHNNAGSVELAAGRPDRARAELEKALALAKEVHGPGEVELAAVRGNLAMVARDDAERAALLAEGVAIRRDRLGGTDPWPAGTRAACAAPARRPRRSTWC